MPGDLGSILREIFHNRGGGGGDGGADNRGRFDNRYHWQPLGQNFFIHMGFIGGNGQLYTMTYPPMQNPGFTDGGSGGGFFGGNGGDHGEPGVFDWDLAKKRVFGVSDTLIAVVDFLNTRFVKVSYLEKLSIVGTIPLRLSA